MTIEGIVTAWLAIMAGLFALILLAAGWWLGSK